MKNEIMQKLSAVINALNSISVSGKNNLANLSGSISVLEEVAITLNDAIVTEKEKEKENDKN